MILIPLSLSLIALVLALGALGLVEQRRREILKTIELVQNFNWQTVKCIHDLQDQQKSDQIKMIQAIAREVEPLRDRLDDLETSLQNVQKYVQ